MSAREIIAEIEALSFEEKAVVVAHVRKVEAELEVIRGNKVIRYVNDSEFERVQQEVFTKHAPLLKKLAES